MERKGLDFTLTLVVIGVVLLMTALTVIVLGTGGVANWFGGQQDRQASTSVDAACNELAKQIDQNYCNLYVKQGDCTDAQANHDSTHDKTAAERDCPWSQGIRHLSGQITENGNAIVKVDNNKYDCVEQGHFGYTCPVSSGGVGASVGVIGNSDSTAEGKKTPDGSESKAGDDSGTLRGGTDDGSGRTFSGEVSEDVLNPDFSEEATNEPNICKITLHDSSNLGGGTAAVSYATSFDLDSWGVSSVRATGDDCSAVLWSQPGFSGQKTVVERREETLAARNFNDSVRSVQVAGDNSCKVTLYENDDFNLEPEQPHVPPQGHKIVVVDDSSNLNMAGKASSINVSGPKDCTGFLFDQENFEGAQAQASGVKELSALDDGWNNRVQSVKQKPGEESVDPIWGVMYFPFDAYNAWQIWANYDRQEIERDMGFAADMNFEAVRLFVSYEYWRDHPEKFKSRFEHFLSTASANGLQTLPMLFESIGYEPIQDNFWDTDTKTAFALHSPSRTNQITHKNGQPVWNQGERSPRAFTRWFAKTYGTDSRILALEIMNEPGATEPRHSFVQDMLQTAHKASPNAKLTMGSKSLHYNLNYKNPELDIYQFHLNVPPEGKMQTALEEAEEFSETYGKPVWLTEWQRIRTIPVPRDDYPAFGGRSYPDKMLPNYESLAEKIRNSDTIEGYFMWGLMLKPAYICKPRAMGRINGLFWDKSEPTVYDLDDARAIAGNPNYQANEVTDLPQGMEWFLNHLDGSAESAEEYCNCIENKPPIECGKQAN